MLHIYLLGHPQVFDDDRPLPLPAPEKVMALWAYLLLKRDRALPREPLAYRLWPDLPESEARANLRRHLYLLRKQLPQGTPWILATRNTLQWNSAADYRLDVAQIDRFDAAQADETAWQALLESYRGDLLEGFYEEWVLNERTRLRRRYLHLLERRILLQKERGDLRGAIHTTQRLLACDPLREEPYRLLMELYYRVGDRAAALREFEQCRAMLRTELQAEPMPETLALRDAIRDGRQLAPLPAPPPASPPPPVSSLPHSPQPAPSATPPPQPAAAPPVHAARRWPGRPLWLALLLTGMLLLGLLLPRLGRPPLTLSISGPEAVQDTWIDEENAAFPYDPKDSERTLKAAYPQVHLTFFGYPYDRVLLRFDLSHLPADARIRRATLHVHLADYTNEDLPSPLPATISAFRVLRPWEAETATFNSPWSQPGMAAGVDYDAHPLGSQSFLGATWFTVEITDLVREWLAHPDHNYGIVLMLTDAPQGAHYWVDTSDYPLADRRPHLDLTYTH